MASAGQGVGGVIGAVIGFFLGGPQGAIVGAQIGMTIGGMIDPPKGPTIHGPRLSDLRVQTATYGANIPRIYGTVATFGNVFWVENNQLKESVKKKKSGGKGGGGGSTIKTYSYSATFAVGLCKGPIAGVRRIWVGSKLIYDAGASDIESIIASNRAATGFAIYTGTTTQEPDPRMQAAIGAANCPAYRGLAYIVLYDYPLADHGNSLLGAQVKVEVVQSVTPLGYQLKLRQVLTGWPQKYHPKSVYSADEGIAKIYGYDPFAGTTTVDGVTIGNDEALLSVLASGAYVAQEPVPIDATRTRFFSSGSASHRVGTVGGVDIWVQEYWTGTAIGTAGRNIIPLGEITNKHTVDAAGTEGSLESLVPSENGKYIKGMAVSKDGQRILLITGASGPDAYFYFDEDLNIVDSGTVTGSVSTLGVCEIEEFNSHTSLEPDYVHGWSVEYGAGGGSSVDFTQFTVESGVMTVSSALTATSFASSPNSMAVASNDGICYAIVRTTTNVEILVVSRDEVSFTGTTLLSSIVSSECLQSNVLQSGDLDVTALTQQVRGYRVTQTGAIRGALEPLQAAWPFDVVQSGYELKFVPRGGSSVATIPATDLDARQDSDAPGVQLTIAHEMDTQLPREVRVKYLDVTREYDDGDQPATRQNTDSIHIRDVELPIVLNAAEAAGMAEVLLYLYWLERRDVQFKLPPSYRALEPADVITITGEWGEYSLRITGVHLLSDGRLECSAKYNSPAIYTPTAVGVEGQSTGQVIALDGPSLYVLLDVPLMRDEDDMPGFPAAMSGYTSGWPGGIIFQSPDDGQTWEDVQGFTGPVPIGYARDTIGAGRTDIIDTANTLQADMVSGELESVAQLAMFAGANHFAYGAHGRWEIIGAANCVLQGDGSYILSDFLRGRFGTEQYMTTHASGDQLVLLTDGDMGFVAVQSSSIGSERSYRGITAGRTIDDDADRAFTYAGVNLECLSPVYPNGNRHPSTNDWTLTWIRRGRVSPSWRNLVDVPLGETIEAYEVDVYSSAAYTTLKRTIAVTAQNASYTSSEQVADFGSNQATLHLKIYQLSAQVGRGYPLTTSITR
jgi:hypothetical protein